jgi:hypothetical protein
LVVLATAVAAHAAELNAAELDGTVNQVTVEQGGSTTFQISFTASGALRCSATPTTPARARLNSAYALDASGVLTGSNLVTAATFYADAFCNVTWAGDPAPQVMSASIAADRDTPLGDYTLRLTPLLSTPSGTGSTLIDSTPTLLTLTVVPGSDTVPPVVGCDGPHATAGANGWYTTAVSFDCSASDAQSGLADASDASFTLTTAGEGAQSTSTRAVKDIADNETDAGPFGPYNVDLADPNVTCGAPTGTAGANGWYVGDVSVSCTATDSGSGLADEGDGSFTLATSGDGSVSTPSRTVADASGRTTTVGPFGPFNVDLADPTIAVTSPLDGSMFLLNQQVAAHFSCADTGSGLATCVGSTADGAWLPTGSVGSFGFGVDATDVAGRASTFASSYRVIYDFHGLSTPNRSNVKAGTTLPTTWSLTGVGDLASFVSASTAACDGTGVQPADTSVLSYNVSTDQFQLNWKTSKTWAGACKQLQIALNDGTTYTLNVIFK